MTAESQLVYATFGEVFCNFYFTHLVVGNKYECILTFSLGLFCSNFERFCRLSSTISINQKFI